MQFAENVQANCSIVTMPDPIQPKQPRREFKNYGENFLNICLIAWTLKNDVAGKRFTDDEEVEKEVRK
jgi:hypothetical protein